MRVDSVFLLALVMATSLLAILLGRARGRHVRGLGAAMGRGLECVGLTMLLLALNVGAGFLFVLALRASTGRFVSVYANTDATLLVCSLVQALVLQAWWHDSAKRD